MRRLAAIVCADVAGFSRLVGEDEEGTLASLRVLRRDVIEPMLADHGGRIANTAGDSLLLEFPSAVNAVRWAIAVQEAIAQRPAGLPAGRCIALRMGIHIGDVVAEGADLLGDGVNVAARIQAMAEPGGIAISDDMHRLVRDRLTLDWRDGGEHVAKNIARPVRIWHWETATASARYAPVLSLPDKPSIAVLPFQNMSGDPEQEYFSDGIVEDVTTNLSKTRGFFVIARNSSFTYKGQAVDVTRVGRELGVRYVLEGSVRKAGERVRITALLIDASSGAHLWAEKYDRDLTDLFAVQDEITREIVGTVAPQMLEAEMRRARSKSAQNLDAWDYAMRAQWHLARLTPEDNAEALRLGMNSHELSPHSTAGLNIAAFAHIYVATYGWPGSGTQPIASAHEAARKAVTLDARDEVAQAALGVSEIFMGRHDDAVARLQNAVELNPNFTWAHGNLGLALAMSGRPAEAISPLQEAIRLSPRDQFKFLWLYLMGFACWLMGQYQDGLDHANHSLRENPNSPGPHRLRAACLSRLGRLEEARASLAIFLRHVPGATIRSARTQLPFKNSADFERYADALRQAGLPE
jgi:TolB-like protein/predicted Zn-dependent protease